MHCILLTDVTSNKLMFVERVIWKSVILWVCLLRVWVVEKGLWIMSIEYVSCWKCVILWVMPIEHVSYWKRVLSWGMPIESVSCWKTCDFVSYAYWACELLKRVLNYVYWVCELLKMCDFVSCAYWACELLKTCAFVSYAYWECELLKNVWFCELCILSM
jgi:hypothetical protein